MISIIFFNLYMPEECLYQKFSVLFVCVCIYMFVCFLTGEVRRKSSFRQSPLLSAAPVHALIDEQISIKGRFLSQNYPVTVCAQMHSEEGDLWEAFAHYTTNASRSINCE